MRAFDDGVSDSDFFDVRLPDEVIDGAVTHSAGAENENFHDGLRPVMACQFFKSGKNF